MEDDDLLANPWINSYLRYPLSDEVEDRIRSNTVAQKWFRDDIYPRDYCITKEGVIRALRECVQDLPGQTILRVARDNGIMWNRENMDQLLYQIGLVIFSRLKRSPESTSR